MRKLIAALTLIGGTAAITVALPASADPATGFQIGPDADGQYYGVTVLQGGGGSRPLLLVNGNTAVQLDCDNKTFRDPRSGQWLTAQPDQVITQALMKVCLPYVRAQIQASAAQSAYDAAPPEEKARVDAQRAADERLDRALRAHQEEEIRRQQKATACSESAKKQASVGVVAFFKQFGPDHSPLDQKKYDKLYAECMETTPHP